MLLLNRSTSTLTLSRSNLLMRCWVTVSLSVARKTHCDVHTCCRREQNRQDGHVPSLNLGTGRNWQQDRREGKEKGKNKEDKGIGEAMAGEGRWGEGSKWLGRKGEGKKGRGWDKKREWREEKIEGRKGRKGEEKGRRGKGKKGKGIKRREEMGRTGEGREDRRGEDRKTKGSSCCVKNRRKRKLDQCLNYEGFCTDPHFADQGQICVARVSPTFTFTCHISSGSIYCIALERPKPPNFAAFWTSTFYGGATWWRHRGRVNADAQYQLSGIQRFQKLKWLLWNSGKNFNRCALLNVNNCNIA